MRHMLTRLGAIVALVFAMASSAQALPANMRLAASSTFLLPIAAPGQVVTVTQGNNMPAGTLDDWDHNPGTAQQYAFDFKVDQKNFLVTAAQSGKVLGVNDTSDIQCRKIDWEISPQNMHRDGCWAHANFIVIANDDGSAALYLHLKQASSLVHVGDPVKQGQPLALAGTTGWSSGIHLHFQVEALPTPRTDPYSGWWFTASRKIAFSDPLIVAKDRDGVPLTGQEFTLPGASGIVPGGSWISPTNGQVVGGEIHFAAHAYPTHPADPAIRLVNFTVGAQGSWKVGCQAAAAQAVGDVFSCDAAIGALGISPGPIDVSFDVYDQAGNVNFAPNGVHTLTYTQDPFAACHAIPDFANASPADAAIDRTPDSVFPPFPSVPFPPASLGYHVSTTFISGIIPAFQTQIIQLCSPSLSADDVRAYYTSHMPPAGWPQSSTFPYGADPSRSCGDPYCWYSSGSTAEFWVSLEKVTQSGTAGVYQLRLATGTERAQG